MRSQYSYPLGSSPRMRGAQTECREGNLRDGIIPAYAGSTHHQVVRGALLWDHPRVCGEHAALPTAVPDGLGSSPRMRGARSRNVTRMVGGGIIPAYAGSTGLSTRRSVRARDHPRVCGEHNLLAYALKGEKGSSPRMRGAQQNVSRLQDTEGIIPAYAGSTVAAIFDRDNHRDHPRVCGEHFDFFLWTYMFLGSSPRMRGAQAMDKACRVWSGIIPAYAGSTLSNSLRRYDCGDHPRVCGEHSSMNWPL